MKRKKMSIVVLMAVISTWTFPGYAIFGLTPFQEAYQKGAEARVVFRVLDDGGSPVQGATVDVFFDMADRSKGRRVVVRTDTNGVCVAEAKTKGVLQIKVTCDGYYKTKDEICFITMGHEHEVKNGRWQPWGMTKETVLRPIRNPKAEKHRIRGYKRTKRLDEWLKFDLEQGDFVSPDGKGKTSDCEVLFSWDRGLGNKYTGMSVKIRFTDKYSGGCYVSKVMYSDFSGAYTFPSSRELCSEFYYFVHEKRNNETGELVEREARKFDATKALLVRSRCKIDPVTGKLLECHYSQISDIRFGCDSDGIAFLVKSFFNPTPNDTNLEPKQ